MSVKDLAFNPPPECEWCDCCDLSCVWPSEPTLFDQQAVIEAVDNDPQPRNQDDSERIRAAILRDGREHGGRVNVNRVRAALTNDAGHLDVYPRRIGPAYNGLVRKGLLRTLGYIDENKDKAGRNDGKPAMAYELTEAGWAA